MVRRKNVPGPGAYEVPGYMYVGGKPSFNKLAKNGTSGFGSNDQRRDRSAAAASGQSNCDPGQYTVEASNSGVHTGKAEPMSVRSARSHNVNASKGRGTFNSTAQRTASAPRIRTFGGPGEYDAGHLYNCGKTGPVVSSSFKSAMPANAHVRKSSTPGVGAYNPSVDCEHERPLSATFKGPERRTSTGSRPTTAPALGPGSYELKEHSIERKLSETRNPRAPPFNASSVRKMQQKVNNAVPGPGTYESQGNETVRAVSARSFNQPSKKGISGFGSNDQRRDRSAAAASGQSNCDPGQYTVEASNSGVHTGKAEPMSVRSARSHNVNASKGRGTFNSTAQRTASAPRIRTFGGPGEYDAGHLYNCGKTGPVVSSSFKSAMPANAHVRKSSTPGVGAYNPSVDCEHERPLSATFKGPERRTSTGSRPTTAPALGPGSYELDQKSISHLLFDKIQASKRAPPFNSSAPRDPYWDE